MYKRQARAHSCVRPLGIESVVAACVGQVADASDARHVAHLGECPEGLCGLQGSNVCEMYAATANLFDFVKIYLQQLLQYDETDVKQRTHSSPSDGAMLLGGAPFSCKKEEYICCSCL